MFGIHLLHQPDACHRMAGWVSDQVVTTREKGERKNLVYPNSKRPTPVIRRTLSMKDFELCGVAN